MMLLSFLTFPFLCFSYVLCQVHPIEIRGRHFYDSVTKKPFFIKGVDYQPGGSTGAMGGNEDPLSNPDVCARDIFLFQELGINTVRIYSINPDLNHDKCMTMLAASGIYLVLDVNSPIQGQHLNRIDPSSTYLSSYLKHIFKVVERFSYYNNTLGFFAGNEIINDQESATVSTVYTKAVIRDLKSYISENSPRKIPVGYSASDDLTYRVSLSKFLECGDPSVSVDFYGLNSYQWCGEQTMKTSGYENLVKDHENYSKPVFLSEYGCNAVTPRLFQEVQALYSTQMSHVFSGGLIYEFSQEPNNYGLVDLDSNGNAAIRDDFDALQYQYNLIKENEIMTDLNLVEKDLTKNDDEIIKCKHFYQNLVVSTNLPKALAAFIKMKSLRNVDHHGEYVELLESDLRTSFKIVGTNKEEIDPKLKILVDIDCITPNSNCGSNSDEYSDLGSNLNNNLDLKPSNSGQSSTGGSAGPNFAGGKTGSYSHNSTGLDSSPKQVSEQTNPNKNIGTKSISTPTKNGNANTAVSGTTKGHQNIKKNSDGLFIKENKNIWILSLFAIIGCWITSTLFAINEESLMF